MPDLPPENTKARPGPLDAFETLKPDEPHWTVQGGDPLGPLTLRFWAKEARERALALRHAREPAEPTAPLPPAESELLLRAAYTEEIASNMEAYQRKQPADSHEDEAYGARAHTMELGEAGSETEAKLIRHRQQRRCEERIDDCVATLTEVREVLRQIDFNASALAVDNILPTLKRIGNDVAPMRRSRQDP